MPLKDVIVPLVSSRTLGQVGSLALLVGLYACLPVWKESSQMKDVGDIPSEFHAALSLVLGWLLVFRTNSAYARWWEARMLWGSLVNALRNLSIKLTCVAHLNAQEVQCLETHITDFPVTLKDHLRRPAAASFETQAEREAAEWNHKPAAIVQQIYAWIGNAKTQGNIDGDELRVLDVELAKLLEIVGGCERIARTPIVRSYRVFARQCIILFLMTLPWGIANDFGWWTIPLTIITSYFMLGMEIVAEHVEEPFGLDEDDLDLDGLCRTIQLSVAEIFRNREKAN